MKKKWLAVVGVIFIMMTVSMNTGCTNTKYNITGEWRVDLTLGTAAGYFIVGFAGNSTSGIVIWDDQSAGEYSVASKDLEFVLRLNLITNEGNSKTLIYYFVGSFEDGSHMNGTVKVYDPEVAGSEVNGTWLAQKL